MQKAVILFLIFVVSSESVFCQKNLRPGYIVLNNNDTIQGFIDYKGWSKNPSRIKFATSTRERLQAYDRNEISYFEITDVESYKKYKVSISLAPNRINDISEKNTATATDEVFLKMLFNGNAIKLFSYQDAVKRRYYVLAKGQANPLELGNSVYKLNEKIVSENEYRRQLASIASTLFPENTSITNTINNAAYSQKDILSICYQLDGIADGDQLKQMHKNLVRLFVGSGMVKTTSSFSGDVLYAGSKSSFTSPLVSFGIDILANPEIKKFYLHNSFTYSTYKVDSKVRKEYYEAVENYLYQLKQNNLAFNVQPVLNWYNDTNLQIFAGVGAIANFAFNKMNNQKLNKEYLNGSTATYNNESYLFLKNFWLNFNVRAGVTVKNVCLSLSYVPKATVSDAKTYALEASSMQLELLYLFHKTRLQRAK